MIRWPLFVVGLGLMVCALIARLQQPPLATEPRRVNLAEALALIGEPANQFVELNARVDADRRIYPTAEAVSRPVYTANPPEQVFPLEPASREGSRDQYLGNLVRVPAGPEEQFVSLQIVQKNKARDKQLVNERLLAPVQGAGYRLWALSAPFAAKDPRAKAWVNQRELRGYLTRFADLEANRKYPRFEHDLAAIYRFAEKEFGQAVPADALLLLTDFDDAPRAASYFYCPVRDSQDTLFYQLTPATVTNVPETLRGVLEPARLELYGDFERILGEKLPARIGILVPGTAEAFNQRRAEGIRTVLATGGVLAALGFCGIVLKRLRRARRAPG